MIAELNVLVVDDEPGITLLCERLLTRAGYSVKSFLDPSRAIKYASQNKVDLLLVDIRMPKIGGFDLIAQIKQEQPDMAVLVMTGFGTVETAIQALRQGVDGLLLKPFETGNELIEAVHQALEDNQRKQDAASIQALKPLFAITESFLAETRPDHLTNLILNAICGNLRCENAGFYRYIDHDSNLCLQASLGDLVPNLDEENGTLLIKRTDSSGTPYWVNVTGPGDPDLQLALMSLRLSSALVAPISRLNVRGVLFAGRDQTSGVFREVEWEMFLMLARQAAVAMENALLYDELRSYVRRIEDSQQALLRAEKMAAAGRLTASIAHEINNPLQGVQNCLHLASRGEIPQKKQREYLDMANHELDRLMNTVQRMLDFYRPGSIEPQRVNVAVLLRHVVSLLSAQLQSRNIRVATGFSSKLPLILGVGSQLEQVFINLILNAYDAMPDGGELRISARPVKDTVEVMVKDTGPGISIEDRAHIFEPFVSTKDTGTGLGLAVSYGIVSAHGGSIDLDPDIKSGACFKVTLPVRGEE